MVGGAKKRKKRANRVIKVNAMISLKDPDINTEITEFSFSHQKTLAGDVIATVLNHQMETNMSKTKGLCRGLFGYDLSDFLVTAAMSQDYFDPYRPLDLKRPLREQISLPCLLVVYVDPEVVAQKDKERKLAILEMETSTADEKMKRLLLQKRQQNIRRIENLQLLQEDDKRRSTLDRQEEFKQRLEDEKRLQAVTPKVTPQQFSAHKKHLSRLQRDEDRRAREQRLMYITELESQAREDCKNLWKEVREQELRETHVQQAQRKVEEQLREEHRRQQQVGRHREIQRYLTRQLDATVESSRNSEENLFDKISETLRLPPMPESKSPASTHTTTTTAAATQSTSYFSAPATYAASKAHEVAVAQHMQPCYTFRPRFPPLHRLPPVQIPDGSHVELGCSRCHPLSFVRYYGPLFDGVKTIQ